LKPLFVKCSILKKDEASITPAAKKWKFKSNHLDLLIFNEVCTVGIKSFREEHNYWIRT
jgi:hypothetical protein